MKERIITITAKFDMSMFPDDMITPKEEVKEMVEEDMIDIFGWDEGYEGVKVEVIDI